MSDTLDAELFTQTGRLLTIDTVLGPDLMLVTEFSGEETVSGLFDFDVALISRDLAVKPEQLVGTRVTLWLRRTDGERTPINGYVKRLRSGRLLSREFREYQAEIVPWLWFLSRATDSRIFQDKSITQVVRAVFEEFGFSDFDMSGLTETYPTLDYVVQYRESALDFVCRWMEEVGIHFHFRHEEKTHTLVLGDHNIVFRAAAEASVGYGNPHQNEITEWQHDYTYRTGTWSQKDFNFETPKAPLLTRQKSLLTLPDIGRFENFDYPGGYTTIQPGDVLTRIKAEADEAAYHTVIGAGGCVSFRAGLRFTLNNHPIDSEAGEKYVLLQVSHRGQQQGSTSGSGGESYANQFVAQPADIRFRPQRSVPRPFVHGPQTAMVVGPPGEIIHTDKYGRVKLQFHWDRRGKNDDKSSCWVRVAQPWGGGGFGGVFIPHVGHEVVVSFLEGDPDRPMVTGRVYNATSMQAVGLPANKTQSAWRDHTGNEMVMEGKGGSQDYRMTAVKDMNIKVTNDRNHTVGASETLKIGANQTQTIQGHRDETVNSGETVTVNGGRTHAVTGLQKTTISLAEVHSVGAGRMHNVGAAESITVGAAQMINVIGAQMVNVGALQSVKVGALQTVSVSGPHKLGAAAIMQTAKGPMKVKAGSVCIIEAPTITLKAGGSQITLSSSGITLKGTKIVLKASSNITLDGSGGVKVKGGSIGEN